MMKKLIILCSVLACTLLLSACSASKSLGDTCQSALQKVGDGLIGMGEILKGGQSSEKDAAADDKTWEDALKDIFQGVESGLRGLYRMFQEDSPAQDAIPADTTDQGRKSNMDRTAFRRPIHIAGAQPCGRIQNSARTFPAFLAAPDFLVQRPFSVRSGKGQPHFPASPLNVIPHVFAYRSPGGRAIRSACSSKTATSPARDGREHQGSMQR